MPMNNYEFCKKKNGAEKPQFTNRVKGKAIPVQQTLRFPGG